MKIKNGLLFISNNELLLIAYNKPELLVVSLNTSTRTKGRQVKCPGFHIKYWLLQFRLGVQLT